MIWRSRGDANLILATHANIEVRKTVQKALLLPVLKIWIRDRYRRAWKKSLEKWATPLTLKIDVELSYVRYRVSANETGSLRRANNIYNSNTMGTELKNGKNRENRQNFDKTELDPPRKYSAR
jgi:hypothetical protein